MERLRQSSVGSIINAAGTMANINQGEAQQDLNDLNAERLRAQMPYVAKLEEANLRRLKADYERIEALIPGSAEAQRARTEYEVALTEALRNKTGFEKRTENIEIQKLEASRDKLLQDIEQGKREHDITFPSGEKVKVNTKEALEFYTDQLRALGRREGELTDYQRYQINRQSSEDAQKNQQEAKNADYNIRNAKREKKDITSDISTFNSRAKEPYVYVPSKRGEFGYNNPVAQIPLPKVKTPQGKELQLTAEDMYREWTTNFRALTFKEFILKYYTDVLKQKPPEGLVD